MEYELDERKTKILNAVIQNYLESGEPVGSRTISKDSDLGLSSATIRNEMADLEELGYIVQPHTSAGRIPSDKGYRFYVDNLMKTKDAEISDVKEMLIEKTDKMEQVLQQVVKVLAANTNYATVISAPSVTKGKVKFIQLSSVDECQLLAVIVLEGNLVRNRMIEIPDPLDNETILKLNILLNSTLNGLDIEQINLGTIARLKEQAGIHSDIVGKVLDAVAESLTEDEDLQVYTSGATNIFKYPELSGSERASELINAFEEKQELAHFLSTPKEDGEENTGIQVYIGNESPLQNMKDCSVVTATYELGEGVQGTIGIIGPKRMDYENVVDNIRTLKVKLDELFKHEERS
jgi:heat-inducible transcriptional repressor